MRKTLTMAVMAVLALPAALAAQGAGRGAEVSAQAQAQAQAQTPEARLAAAFEAAANANVPRALIESKIAEGRAKQVPEDRIATAVEARLEALVRASEALRRAEVQAASEADLTVAADAMQAGINQSLLVRVARGADENRRVVAIAVLADLVRLGHDPERATARVSAAATSNAALANLHAEVAAQVRRGGLIPTLDGVAGGRTGIGVGRRP